MHELMIIGAGPAGLAAAVYAARKRLKALLVSGDIGGQVNQTLGIENYLGYQFIEGAELIAKFESQVSQFPIDQKIGTRISRLGEITDGFEAISETGDGFQARVVLFATGKRPKKLGVSGEAEFAGKGVSYCAICDGPVFAGQRVAIVGGGNSAVGAALDMVRIAEHVDLVSLTPLTADIILIEKLVEASNVSVYAQYQTEKIYGNAFVSGIVIKGLVTGEEKRLDASGVFIEIGLAPNSEPVKDLIELNKWGEVPVSCANETTMPGLYAAGDVTDVPEKQIIVAAGEGAKAVLQAHRYLQQLAK
ncbi:MAG: FAD-dependent oxidoreductase [Chloroflexi bacterium]|nr:FAD-dependent oxidoreductase [Chloroflexota bacterium]